MSSGGRFLIKVGENDTQLSNSLFHYNQGHGRVLRACSIHTEQRGPSDLALTALLFWSYREGAWQVAISTGADYRV